MLGLKLRDEFKGPRIKGTVVDFSNKDKTGALDVKSDDFLKITYPSIDILKALENCRPENAHPIVLQGARGQGKSHLMAVLYHVFKDTDAAKRWLDYWSGKLDKPKIKDFVPSPKFNVIAESLHKQRYKFLWDLLFEQHSKGEFYRGKWDNQTPVPSYDLLVQMFKEEPTVLLLDEFQTWFEGLTNTKQAPYRSWAFNFIQILSEIAKEMPDNLVLVVSVRDSSSDAYQQLHRIAPVMITFTENHSDSVEGVEAGVIAIKKHDRQKMILHRLFENRDQVPNSEVDSSIRVHIQEFFRIKSIPESEHAKWVTEFNQCWPYSPILLRLLEDQVLVSTDAQETRDLIRILASLYRAYENQKKIITAACFRIDQDKSGVTVLIDSISGEYHEKLLEKARRNLESVQNVFANDFSKVSLAPEIISSLWIRSLVVENRQAGAEVGDLQLDVTQDKVIDENTFQLQINNIVDNSFNIHESENRYLFKPQENADAKLKAYARNEKLYGDGSDIEQLSKELEYVLNGNESDSSPFKIIVLRKHWLSNPWSELPENIHPTQLRDGRIPLVVIPENGEAILSNIGKWLKEHWLQNRNTVRFLIPRKGQQNIYFDKDLIFLSRLVLKAHQWKKDEHEFASLLAKYRGELRGKLKSLFDRFAILEKWDFAKPDNCKFVLSSHGAEGDRIPNAINEIVVRDLFIPEDFDSIAIEFAHKGESISRLIAELKEPRSNSADCVPWIGEERAKEEVLKLCAGGKIAINVRGLELLQLEPGESFDEAWHRIKGKLGRGRELDSTNLMTPQAITGATGSLPRVAEGQAFTPTTHPTDSGESPVTTGSIFDNPASNKTFHHLSSEYATSPLNLLGKTESWGIGPATTLKDVHISVGSMTGAQIQRLLKNLPDGVTYSLELEKEEE